MSDEFLDLDEDFLLNEELDSDPETTVESQKGRQSAVVPVQMSPEYQKVLAAAKTGFEIKGTNPRSVKNYLRALGKFFEFLTGKDIAPSRLYPSIVKEYVDQTWANQGSRATTASLIKGAMLAAEMGGITLAPLDYRVPAPPKKPKKEPKMPELQPREMKEEVNPSVSPIPVPIPAVRPGTPESNLPFDLNMQPIIPQIPPVPIIPQSPVPNPVPNPVPVPQQQQQPVVIQVPYPQQPFQQSFYPQQVPYHQQPATSGRGGKRTMGSELLPAGSKFRISKKATGMEPGISPGTLIKVGTYTYNNVLADGSIDVFIERNIHSRVGSRTSDTIYVAEVLNEKDQVVRSDEFPFAPNLSAVPEVPVHQQQPQTQANPVYHPVNSNDRIVDIMMKREADLQNTINQMNQQMLAARANGNGGGNDVVVTMMMLQNMQRERGDLTEAIARIQAENGNKERSERRERDLDSFPIPQQVPVYSPPPPPMSVSPGFGDLGSGPSQTDLMMKILDKFESLRPPTTNSNDKIMELLLTSMITQKAEGPKQDPLMLELLRQAKEENTQLRTQFQTMIERQQSDVSKTKSLNDTLTDLEAVLQFKRKLTGEDVPTAGIGMGEVLMSAFENFEKIGEGLSKMMFKPPQLQGPKQRQLAEVSQNQLASTNQPVVPNQPKVVQTPAALQEAIVSILSIPADKDQELVEAFFKVVQVMAASGQPWTTILERTQQHLLQVDSKPELRTVITNFFENCGAKKLIEKEPSLVSKITDVLHRNYSELYPLLSNGQQKTLSDADPLPVANEDGNQTASGDQVSEEVEEGIATDGGNAVQEDSSEEVSEEEVVEGEVKEDVVNQVVNQ